MLSIGNLFQSQVSQLRAAVEDERRAANIRAAESAEKNARIADGRRKGRAIASRLSIETQGHVLNVLCQHGPLRSVDLSTKSGVPLSTTFVHIGRLVDAGKIKNIGTKKRAVWQVAK